MTLVTGTVQDLGYDGMEGTLWARPARFRSDGQVVLAPERKPFKITGGVVSAELAPGPAVLELQVGSHARGTFEVVIPETDITLADLLDTVFPWEPAQVSLFVAEREAAQQAKADAEQAATLAGTAKTDAELAAQQTGQDRAHVDSIRQTLDEAAQSNVAPYLTQSELNATYVSTPIDLGGLGMSHLNTAAQNSAILTDALAEADGTGRQIVLPHCPPSAWIDLDAPAVIALGGVAIVGQGRGQTRLRQTGRMQPLFDVQGPNVTVSGFTAKHATENPTSDERAQWRGEPGTGKLAVVRVQADNVHVSDVEGVTANAVVHFAAWDVAADAARGPLVGCSAHNIRSTRCVFGLLAVGVSDFEFGNVSGSYELLPGWTTPPHLVYFSDGFGMNYDVRGGVCQAVNGQHGQAYQLKNIQGGDISQLLSRNALGVLNVMGCSDLDIGTIASYEDSFTDDVNASLIFQGANDNVRIGQVVIRMSANGRPVRIIAGSSDISIRRLRVTSKHTATSTSADVDIDGERNVVSDVQVDNIGTYPWEAGVRVFAGTDNRIVRPVTSGNRFGVAIRPGATGATVEDYALSEMQATVYPFNIAASTLLRPRPDLTSPAPSRPVALSEDGSTPEGSAQIIKWPQVGPQWVSLFGEWRVMAGLIRPGAVAVNAALVADLGSSNLSMDATITYADREGLLARATDRNNTLVCRLNHNTQAVEVTKRAEGVETVLASIPLAITVGTKYTLAFTVVGDRIRATVNGVVNVDHTLSAGDLAAFTATRHGMICNGNQSGGFTNIRAYV